MPRYAIPTIEDWRKQVSSLTDWRGAADLYGQMRPRGLSERLMWGPEYKRALMENPYAQEWASRVKEANKGDSGMLRQGLKQITNRKSRIDALKVGAMAAGGYAAGGGFGGVGAGVGGGATGFGGTAGGVGAEGIGGIGGVGGTKLSIGGIASLLGGGRKGGTMGLFDSDDDDGGFNWKEGLLKLAANYASNRLLGGRTSEERALGKFSTAPYESSETQRFLPPELRAGNVGPFLSTGIGGIASLLQNPGGLSPNVAEAINPRLAAESQNIAQQFRGIGANQAGAAARGNLPVSIKGALQSALDIAQERAQRGARGAALTESEDLRRRDVEQTYKILDAILQFISSGRGQAIPGLGQAAGMSGTRQAANLAQVSSLLQSLTQQGQA